MESKWRPDPPTEPGIYPVIWEGRPKEVGSLDVKADSHGYLKAYVGEDNIEVHGIEVLWGPRVDLPDPPDSDAAQEWDAYHRHHAMLGLTPRQRDAIGRLGLK